MKRLYVLGKKAPPFDTFMKESQPLPSSVIVITHVIKKPWVAAVTVTMSAGSSQLEYFL